MQNVDLSSTPLPVSSDQSSLPKVMMEVKANLTLAQHYTLLKELQECREALQQCREALRLSTIPSPEIALNSQSASSESSIHSSSTPPAIRKIAPDNPEKDAKTPTKKGNSPASSPRRPRTTESRV
jgi:hypothetical protein